jgi:NADPH-dependent ferric siderophore reductase
MPRPGIELRWQVNSRPEAPNTMLFNAVRAVDWLPGRVNAWVAGEISPSLAIRTWLKNQRGLPRTDRYVSSYWQIGQTEDGHRVTRRNTADA